MSIKLTITAARAQFANLINRAEDAGERTIVHRRNRPVAAVVPIEDLELIERYEDELDLRLVKRVRREKTIPWEKIKKELGL